ncbi:MAG: polyisoprenoid-binding protein [Alphaproteobacteria bacterium]|nr:polyisoprenoid-binding protein [Alphaproteobacteria bacterium]
MDKLTKTRGFHPAGGMFRNAILFCLLSTGLFGLSEKSVLADERYAFDKGHSSILFSVSRFGFFQEKGEFSDYDGDFVFCTQHPDKDAISITFYSAGIRTSDEETDEDLRGPDFFNAAQFPQMRFVSTAVKLVDKDNAKITGNLTLLGVTKPVAFDAHFAERDDDTDNDDYVASFSASGVIKRSDFGMNHLIPIIGDEVHLRIQVKGIKKNAD